MAEDIVELGGEIAQANAEIAALRQRVADLESDYLRRHNDAVDCFEAKVALEAAAAAMREGIELILPLAKGYSPDGQSAQAKQSCSRWIEAAETALSTTAGKAMLERVERLEKALIFYGNAWEGHPGDSGPGGNTPADPEQWPDEKLLDDGGELARHTLISTEDE